MMFRFIARWLGLNPDLPFYWDVHNPMHGEEAKNGKRQKVIYDKAVNNWVMPQDFSDKTPVSVK